jgi:translation initiation factor SUI1
MNNFMLDVESELDGGNGPAGPKVHVRMQQRTTRKSITTIEGLDKYMDKDSMVRMLKKMKKTFSCGGALLESEEHGTVVKLAGDNRRDIKAFLVTKYKILEDRDLILHGF